VDKTTRQTHISEASDKALAATPDLGKTFEPDISSQSFKILVERLQGEKEVRLEACRVDA